MITVTKRRNMELRQLILFLALTNAILLSRTINCEVLNSPNVNDNNEKSKSSDNIEHTTSQPQQNNHDKTAASEHSSQSQVRESANQMTSGKYEMRIRKR